MIVLLIVTGTVCGFVAFCVGHHYGWHDGIEYEQDAVARRTERLKRFGGSYE